MKTGNDIIIRLLKEFYLRTTGARGSVLEGAKSKFRSMVKNGFNVEYGSSSPKYNFIYIPRKKFSKEVLKETLTKLELHGIIITTVKNMSLVDLMKIAKSVDSLLQTSVYVTDNDTSIVRFYNEGRINEFKR